MSWLDVNAPLRSFMAAFCSPDLSACLPKPPAGSERPRILSDELTLRSPFCWPAAHLLLTFLAYGDKRRGQKKRANGWQPALRKLPPLEQLASPGLLGNRQAARLGTLDALLAEDLDLLVRMSDQTRRRILKNDPKAAEWEEGLVLLLARVWGRAEIHLYDGWSVEQMLAWMEDAWRACWRRMFATKPPAVLFPPLPSVPDLDKVAMEAFRRAAVAARGEE